MRRSTNSFGKSLWSNFILPRAMISHFSRFILSPDNFSNSKNIWIAIVKDFRSFINIVVSSANWMTLYSKLFIVIQSASLHVFNFSDNISATSINNNAEIGQPWRILLVRLKFLDRYPLFIVQDWISIYNKCTHEMKTGPQLNVFKVSKRKFHSTVSNAFWKSIKTSRPKSFAPPMKGGLGTIFCRKFKRFLCFCGATLKIFFMGLLVHTVDQLWCRESFLWVGHVTHIPLVLHSQLNL